MATINREGLMIAIAGAKTRVRFLGVLSFDINLDKFKEDWCKRIDSGTLLVEIICEAAHFVSGQSIIASNKKISGEERSYELGSFINIINAPEAKLRKYFIDNNCRNLEPVEDIPKDEREGYKQYFSLRTCYLQIPIPAVNIDDDYYIALPLTRFSTLDKFEKIDETHTWYNEFSLYFKTYFDNPEGAKRFSTEETKKGNRLEIIQAFDEKRNPIGILPRDSFLDTVQVKLVVWALIFTRSGKLLIHKRKENAKDNQGMWDKSVGGHVAIDDVDTVKAVARELAEELYIQEASEQGEHGKITFVKVNSDKMIFLGEWLPDRRYTLPFEDVKSHKDEYYYFRMNYPFSTTVKNSPRHLPNGDIQDVSVFADVYVCIAAENFDTDKLENSEYEVLELYELKDAFNSNVITRKNGKTEKFSVSPDLRSIIRSSMWDDLASFSDYVKTYFSANGNGKGGDNQ